MDQSKSSGRKVFAAFFLFFLGIIAVNSVFIYVAVKSHTGVITENPYEKGLNYDQVIDKAKAQPKVHDIFEVKDNTLYWSFMDEENGNAVINAHVTVRIIRPIQDGFDVELTLEEAGDGQYFVILDLPMKGQWQAHLKAIWDSQEYQTTHMFQLN